MANWGQIIALKENVKAEYKFKTYEGVAVITTWMRIFIGTEKRYLGSQGKIGFMFSKPESIFKGSELIKSNWDVSLNNSVKDSEFIDKCKDFGQIAYFSIESKAGELQALVYNQLDKKVNGLFLQDTVFRYEGVKFEL